MKPGKKLALKKILILFAVLLVGSYIYVQMPLNGSEGKVLDSTTQQPIQDVTVTLECFKSQFHGSKKVRDVAVISDIDGAYRFTLWDVFGCDTGFVNPSKEGYQDSSSISTGYSYTNYGRIPRVRYLTKDADVTMLKLKSITPPKNANVYRNGVRSYVSEYEVLYRNFIHAKTIAESEREIKFVLDRYCEKLATLYSHLDTEDKAHIANMLYSKRWRGITTASDHNYEREVLRYCTQIAMHP